jgi:hypothetical protein
MESSFQLTDVERSFLDHFAYETTQHRPGLGYRWCREHDVEPHELAPLGQIAGYEYVTEEPKCSWSPPWQTASELRERARTALDFLRSTGHWAVTHTQGRAQPLTRHEREFYDLWWGEVSMHYLGRAHYLAARRGITYDHFSSMWLSYAAAWNSFGYSWCYHIPPLPLDLDLPCPWDSAEAMASRINQLTSVSAASS